jgi:hypothetical protein
MRQRDTTNRPDPTNSSAGALLSAGEVAALLRGELVEAIAHRVVEILREAGPSGTMRRMVTAGQLADILDVSKAYIYQHAKELGGVRLGRNANAPLRFDVERALEAIRLAGEPKPQRTQLRPRRRGAANALPSRGRT